MKGIIKPKMKEKSTMAWMRILCAVFVVISLVIALLRPAAIVTLMSLLVGCAFGLLPCTVPAGREVEGNNEKRRMGRHNNRPRYNRTADGARLHRRHTSFMDERSGYRLDGYDNLVDSNAGCQHHDEEVRQGAYRQCICSVKQIKTRENKGKQGAAYIGSLLFICAVRSVAFRRQRYSLLAAH